ncbi:MAG: AraC family transcriptional regulator [Clostridia bacterium]
MRKTVVNRFREFNDFNIIQYGHEDCAPGYSIGNFVRSNYLIHYIHKGSGVYKANGREYSLKANDAFLIRPDEITYYAASKEDPWEYSWVEFSGDGISKFLEETDFSDDNLALSNIPECAEHIKKLVSADVTNQYLLAGYLYQFLSVFVSYKPNTGSMADEYVKAAVNYIHTFYYHTNINVEQISSFIGIDRSYLYRIFKEKTGVSPKKYIIDYKLKTAAKLLRETSLSVGQVALSAGFDDQLYFSTVFKKCYGLPPTKYRQ